MNKKIKFKTSASSFSKIPGSPIAYWVHNDFIETFNNKLIKNAAIVKQGLATCNNNLFVRFWHEISVENFKKDSINRTDAKESNKKWFPYNKGGDFRKWYGNAVNVVNWQADGRDIHAYNKIPLDYGGAPVRAKDYYFKEGITYGLITSSEFSARFINNGFVFDVGGSMIFPESVNVYYLLALACSKVCRMTLKVLNPTLNFQVGDISNVPLIEDTQHETYIVDKSKECIELSSQDWDSFETSWDFKKHPLI